MVDPLISKTLGGQPVLINTTSKVLILELREVFVKAGSIFSWDEKWGQEAFGINRLILKEILDNKLKLLIHYNSDVSKREYWATFDHLRDFMDQNTTTFSAKGTTIYNFPLELFTPKPTRSDND